MALVVIDPGHGGANPGAVYNGRQEKDDVLALSLAVGNILEQNGVDVYFTRTTDVYESPYQKATEGNQVGADYFVSIHRNSSPYPNQYTGVETLVYNRYGEAARMAYNINAQLEEVGFVNQGVNERPNLVVLNSTQMPAVLVEVGFINNDQDNVLFDERFDDIARAIADGILQTIWS
ncbi:MAG TPA: N-acetylmuramoyl-L-alanine amidase [Candidatus Acetatifactor stercoripullorum]|uniref:N-acetylmuramoyl-L-alanine amidase n=1 Tax=Candidatus Acetatifactor stercoripullorum TaxID=2838414 RepID=A0A9D1R7Q7_9FIRM|nr:N-acetylmuramoyl-L-alanine amidase [Candidatus Acetatifactor stercoripullorum]